MATNKVAGQTCYVNVGTIDYKGPALSAYIFAKIVQGSVSSLSSLKYISPVHSIYFAGSGVWTTYTYNIRLIMAWTGQPVNAGEVSCTVVICDDSDLSTAKELYAAIISGAFNF